MLSVHLLLVSDRLGVGRTCMVGMLSCKRDVAEMVRM